MDDKKDDSAVIEPTLVVLGLDSDGKAHASRFEAAHSQQAIKAAGLMGLHAIRVTDAELQKTANDVPVGKIFVTGRGLVPFVKRELYDKLAVLIGTDAEVRDDSGNQPTSDEKPVTEPEKVEGGAKPSTEQPASDLWNAIKIGSTVLARSVESEEGWYEAIVVSAAADGAELTLRWRDYASEPVIKRKRRALAIIPVGA